MYHGIDIKGAQTCVDGAYINFFFFLFIYHLTTIYTVEPVLRGHLWDKEKMAL